MTHESEFPTFVHVEQEVVVLTQTWYEVALVEASQVKVTADRAILSERFVGDTLLNAPGRGCWIVNVMIDDTVDGDVALSVTETFTV